MALALVPLSLNGILDRTFRLIGRTFLRNLIIGALFFIPGAILFAWGFELVAGGMGDILAAAARHQRFSWELLQPLLGGFLVFLLMGFAFFLLEIVAYLGAMYVAASEIAGEGTGWGNAVQTVLTGRVLKAVVQAILQILAIAGIMLIPYAGIIAGAVSGNAWIVLLMVPLILAGAVAVIYLSIAWLFAQPAIAWEDAGIIGSFGRSMDLVGGRWWRTFGIYILLSLIVGLAISVVTTPISFLAFWPFLSKYLQLFQPMHDTFEPSAEQIMALLSKLGPGIGIMTAANGILQTLTMPVYLMVMYFDLRARGGEFPGAGAAEDPQQLRPLVG